MKKLSSAKKNGKLILGLTGGFGSGKSTVAAIFRRLGGRFIAHIDADEIAHQLICPGTGIYRMIVAIWGEGILKKDNSIDREKFGRLIFSDKKQRERLQRIIHPAVIKAIGRDVRGCAKKVVILDVPLLIESGLDCMVDKLIVVNASKKSIIERKLGSAFIKRSDIIKRINAQMPLEEKVKLADFIIDNNGTIAQTRKQVKEIWKKITGE